MIKYCKKCNVYHYGTHKCEDKSECTIIEAPITTTLGGITFTEGVDFEFGRNKNKWQRCRDIITPCHRGAVMENIILRRVERIYSMCGDPAPNVIFAERFDKDKLVLSCYFDTNDNALVISELNDKAVSLEYLKRIERYLRPKQLSEEKSFRNK